MNKIGCVGFGPVVDGEAAVLILGSMPSVASLAANEYYAHPHNRFWPLMARLLEGRPAPPASYEDRLAMLLRNHIALWDSIATCERDGSLDSAIKNETANDFVAFLSEWRNIRVIACNGAKSFQCFRKYNGALMSDDRLRILSLPSTSPANARFTLDKLMEAWQVILAPLQT